jgi:plastocyanin
MEAHMRVPLVLLALVAAAVAIAAPAGAKAPVQITIRHQVHGCHAWSVANDAYYPAQTVRVQVGTSFTITNNDVMPHTLVQLKGPRIALHSQRMGHMGATTAFTLRRPGTYRFVTKPGEDYPGMGGMKTTGEDNVLHLMIVAA